MGNLVMADNSRSSFSKIEQSGSASFASVAGRGGSKLLLLGGKLTAGTSLGRIEGASEELGD